MEKHRTILIADDEAEIREILSLVLEREGYHTILATNGQEVLEKKLKEIDLFLLDIDMPILDGIMTAVRIRREYETPIIFLTAFSGEQDRIKGFSVGADDYLPKPFSNIELLMRIRAVLKRSYPEDTPGAKIEPKEKNIIKIQDIILDKNSRSIRKDGKNIVLTDKEYKIMELLATHKTKIFSLQNLYESIWEEKMVTDNVIMAHIKNLRKKLGDNSKNAKYIKTAWGRGYYLE